MVLRPPVVLPDNLDDFDCPYDGPIPFDQMLPEGVNGPIDLEYRQVGVGLDEAFDSYPNVNAYASTPGEKRSSRSPSRGSASRTSV